MDKPKRRFNNREEAHNFLRKQEPELVRIHPTAIIYHDHVNFENDYDIGVGEYSVIGKIGFGYEPIDWELKRVNHVGRVIIESHVEIGALTAIDRSKLPEYPTKIKRYTKIDNHVHVGHNAVIGKFNEIVAGVVIGGSVITGDNCFIGMHAMIKDGVKIGNNVIIGGGTNVLENVPDNSIVVGNPGKVIREARPNDNYLPLRRLI